MKSRQKKYKVLALIPARSGSIRILRKNIKPLAGHPLIAYTIAAASASGIFDKIIVSTDSEEIRQVALYYGAEAPFLRPKKFATSVSPDIEWLRHALSKAGCGYDCFSILRSSSPFRSAATIRRAWQQFIGIKNAHSLRAVELCHQHPGKMWVVKGKFMKPLLDQSHLKVAWHAGQYQALPKVYVQNSSLEIAWTKVVRLYNSREGKIITPFFTEGAEGFSLDYEEDWHMAEHMIKHKKAVLPVVNYKPYGHYKNKIHTI
ncbi:MAG: acylneuraminate cytidylyltransferase family protein [Candidatus Omnitrophota bacterium]